jgi:hypothetical protein
VGSLNADRICPASLCAPAFRKMIAYVFSVTDAWGAMPGDLYTNVRGYLLSLAGDDFVFSATHQYTGLQVLGHGRSGSLLSAKRVPSGQREGQELVVKCSSKLVCDLRKEYKALAGLQSESWTPKIYEFFEIPQVQLECYSLERLAISLPGYASVNGLFQPHEQAIVGKHMIRITKSLHEKFQLRHGALHADNWMLRDASDLSSVALIDFGRAEPGTPEMYLEDIRAVVAAIRFLGDLDKTHFLSKHISRKNIEETFPSSPMNHILNHVFSIDRFDGSTIYSEISERLTQLGISDGVSRIEQIIRSGPTLQTEQFVYELEDPAIDSRRLFVPAIRWSRRDDEDARPVTLKCAHNVTMEYERMTNFVSEEWAPNVWDKFTSDLSGAPWECIVIERVQSLAPGGSTNPMRLGLEMLMIIETLHEKYKMTHRNASWGIAAEDGRLVLLNFRDLMPVKKDPKGYHRIRELKRLVLLLRNLIDRPNAKLLYLRNLPTEICPKNTCPPTFKKMVQYVFSIGDDWGVVPPTMYTELRGYLLELAGRGVLSDDYIHVRYFGRGESASVVTANRIKGGKVVIKCSSEFVDGDLIAEYSVLSSLQGEGWVPIIYDFFTVPEFKLECFVMERLAMSLELYSRERGILTLHQLGIVGLAMTTAIQSLHEIHGLRHSDLHPGNWMLRDASDISSVVLIDFGRTKPITSPLTLLGDIKEILVTVRFLLDLDPQFTAAKRLKYDKNIFKSCPPLLQQLIKSVFGMTEFEENIYARMAHVFRRLHL